MPLRLALEAQRGHLFPWTPVMMACGIAWFFSRRDEPAVWVLIVAGVVGAVGVVGGLLALRRHLGGALIVAAALMAVGVAVAGARLHLVAGPVLTFRYYGPVEGRIVAIDRSASDKVRLTLDRVFLSRVDPDRIPRRVRVSLHGRQGFLTPMPGQRVAMTAHLSPPQGPTEPHGFDFRRDAFFKGLGAVGYTRVPALLLAHPPPGAGLWVHRLRHALADRIRAGLPGRVGGFSAAIVTGDRSSLDRPTLTRLRRTNLAHLLAISGLHMGLLTGLVLGLVRLGLALVPRISLYHSSRKIAALAALVAAAAYLVISGANVATQRAFVMVAVMLVAVLLDRRAISLRAVALAALIVLVLRPESLLGPGFQMSFAATTALVAVFGWIRDRTRAMADEGTPRRAPRWLRPALGLAMSSLIAGLATAPVAAAHFNVVSRFGYLANLASVPVMGVLVMPGGFMAVLGMPLGMEGPGLAMMHAGVGWILMVADRISDWPGAVGHIVAPSGATLAVVAIGGLLGCLLRGRLRAVGVPVLLVGAALWTSGERPALLISESGGLVGMMGPEGRQLSRPSGEGFVAGTWLENDGDGAEQAAAFARGGAETVGPLAKGPAQTMTLQGRRITHLRGKRAAARLAEACRLADLVVWSGRVEAGAVPDGIARRPSFGRTGERGAAPVGTRPAPLILGKSQPSAPCLLLDSIDLRRLGAMAGAWVDGELQLIGATETTGDRLWVRAPRR